MRDRRGYGFQDEEDQENSMTSLREMEEEVGTSEEKECGERLSRLGTPNCVPRMRWRVTGKRGPGLKFMSPIH